MTDKEIEAAAKRHLNRSYDSPGPSTSALVVRDFLAGAAHMQPKIKELEGKLAIARLALTRIDYACMGYQVNTARVLAYEALDKTREGE